MFTSKTLVAIAVLANLVRGEEVVNSTESRTPLLGGSEMLETTSETTTRTEMDWSALERELRVSEHYVSRCSRRYSPGACQEPVTSVWSFEFHSQNCTERLGCRFSSRTNRFRSFSRCMRRCEPLVKTYSHILMHQVQRRNGTPVLRIGTDSRREVVDGFYSDLEEENTPDPTEEEDRLKSADEPRSWSIDYMENSDLRELEEMMAPDIDNFGNEDYEPHRTEEP